MTDVPLPISVVAWLICLIVLAPAPWRLIRRRSRYSDALLSLVALLVVNRLSFLLFDLDAASHGTAVVLALTMAWLAGSYQREERKRRHAQLT